MRISDWSSDVCSSDLWNRDAKTYTARGNARAASGEVEVQADVLIAYYREPAEGGEGDSEIYLLEAAGSVRIKSPEGTVYGDKGRYRSEEHTSELQSLMRISYAVFCLKKKIKNTESDT